MLFLVAMLPASVVFAGPELIFSDSFEASCFEDADLDRLSDCLETLVYQTDPESADTDEDGLRDGDEVLGTLAGLDLPGLGVNPRKKDILVEYDWINDASECAPHSHQPTQAMMDLVSAMFAASPVTNPDGTTGIHMVQDFGQGGLFGGGNVVLGANTIIAGTPLDPEFQGYKAANFATNRQNYFHYFVIGHRFLSSSGGTGYSGVGELFGDDAIVTLYCYYSNAYWVASTIAHELGHNLGLHHGGSSADACNDKPNYNSIMNYRYSFSGVDLDCNVSGDGVMDYSRGTRITLNENNLNEAQGICGPIPIIPIPVDWNQNSTVEGFVAWDINSLAQYQDLYCGGYLSTLNDHDDWSSLFFMPALNLLGGALPPPEPIVCPLPPLN